MTRQKMDSNAPKPNQSAIQLYENAMKATFLSQNPKMSTLQLSRHSFRMFCALHPDEQQEWIVAGEKDKTRYLMELSNYVPPMNCNARGFELRTINQRWRTKKKIRDPNAPANPKSSLTFFVKENIPKLQEEHPDWTTNQRFVKITELYGALDAKERAPYDKLRQLDYERYQKEMKAYIPPPGYSIYGYKITNTAKKGLTRPRDPYVFYLMANQQKVRSKHPEMSIEKARRYLSAKWSSLSMEEKEPFKDYAEEDKRRFDSEVQELEREKRQKELCERDGDPTTTHDGDATISEGGDQDQMSEHDMSEETQLDGKQDHWDYYSSMDSFLEPTVNHKV